MERGFLFFEFGLRAVKHSFRVAGFRGKGFVGGGN